MMSKGNLIKVMSKEKPAQPCGFILVVHMTRCTNHFYIAQSRYPLRLVIAY